MTDEIANGATGASIREILNAGPTRAITGATSPTDTTQYLYGPDFVVDGTELYNFPADDYQRVVGQEYLAKFQSLAVAGSAWKLAVWGDSRFDGSNQTGNYILDANLKWLARQRGYLRGTFVNDSVSGSTIEDWTTTHVDTYLDGTGDPNLIVFGGGINDLYIPFGPATPQEVVDRLDDFLTKIRTTKGYALDELSIVIVVPPSAYNPTDGRDPRYIEPLRDGFKRLARKWQVCFIDGYGVAADGRNQRGLGYAADITDPEVIHQNNTGMLPIVDIISNTIFPVSGGLQCGLYIESGTGENFTAATLPSAYPIGISLFRATPGGGGSNWISDGTVATINHPDDIQIQFNFATASSDRTFNVRKGRSGAWGSWTTLLNDVISEASVTAGTGYSIPGSENMRTVIQGGSDYVICDGYLTKTVPGTIASGTTIGTVASGYRPQRQLWGVPLAVWDSTNWEFINASVATTGEIVTQQAVTITATRVYFAGGAAWIRA